MDLKEFVKETLSQIFEGVTEAQKAHSGTGDGDGDASINPSVQLMADDGPKGKHYSTRDDRLVHMVEFDVALIAADGKGGKAGVIPSPSD